MQSAHYIPRTNNVRYLYERAHRIYVIFGYITIVLVVFSGTMRIITIIYVKKITSQTAWIRRTPASTADGNETDLLSAPLIFVKTRMLRRLRRRRPLLTIITGIAPRQRRRQRNLPTDNRTKCQPHQRVGNTCNVLWPVRIFCKAPIITGTPRSPFQTANYPRLLRFVIRVNRFTRTKATHYPPCTNRRKRII